MDDESSGATALVIIADGSEELEAVTVIDVLRRAGVEVVVAGLSAGPVVASRGVRLLPDAVLGDVVERDFTLVVLPGGLGGTRRLAESVQVGQVVERQLAEGRLLGAICAAPAVPRGLGLLAGRTVTSYPGAIPSDDPAYRYVEDAVVVDGPLVTSRGPGTAMDFALVLVERLCGKQVRDDVEAGLVRTSMRP